MTTWEVWVPRWEKRMEATKDASGFVTRTYTQVRADRRWKGGYTSRDAAMNEAMRLTITQGTTYYVVEAVASKEGDDGPDEHAERAVPESERV